MLERIPELPDDVVGLTARGEVTRDDYRDVLEPAVRSALEHHQKIRILYVIGDDVTGFAPGAIWEDAKVGLEHLGRWERIAVVTGKEWLRRSLRAFAWLIPSEVEIFDVADESEARAWVTG